MIIQNNRFILALLLIVASFSASAKAVDPCERDLNPFVPTSRWGENYLNKQESESLFEIVSYHDFSAPSFPAPTDVAGKRDPELIAILNDLGTMTASPRDFGIAFAHKYSSVATDADLYLYYQNRLNLIETGLQELTKRLKIVDAELAPKVEKSIYGWLKELSKFLKKIENISTDQKLNGLQYFYNKTLGFFAELKVNLLMNNVMDIGIYFSQIDIFKTKIDLAFLKFEQEVISNPDAIFVIKERYPHALKTAKFTSEYASERDYLSNPENVKLYLKAAKERILSKEADAIIQLPNGDFRMVEVKYSEEPDSKGKLTSTVIRSKSKLEQLLEDVEIISIMGLDDHMKVQYISTAGVTDGGVRLLQKYFIEVLQ